MTAPELFGRTDTETWNLNGASGATWGVQLVVDKGSGDFTLQTRRIGDREGTANLAIKLSRSDAEALLTLLVRFLGPQQAGVTP